MAFSANTINGRLNAATRCQVGGDSGGVMLPRPTDARWACSQHYVDGSMAAQATVPDVTGAQEDVARELLAVSGLVAVFDGYQTSGVARGEVLAQLPGPGASVEWVSRVELVLSDGQG